jgi:hypothetical protein
MKPRAGAPSRIDQERVIPAPPEEVFRAFADPKVHAAFTESRATGRARVGQRFTAWDGYIFGRTLVVEPGRRAAGAGCEVPIRLDRVLLAPVGGVLPRPGPQQGAAMTGMNRIQIALLRKAWEGRR